MADKITLSRYLDINAGFADEDTRRIKVPNPKASITTEQVQGVERAFINSSDTSLNLIVGDRAGAQFVGFLTVDSIEAQDTSLDLS